MVGQGYSSALHRIASDDELDQPRDSDGPEESDSISPGYCNAGLLAWA